jgi:hypothetical protein
LHQCMGVNLGCTTWAQQQTRMRAWAKQ